MDKMEVLQKIGMRNREVHHFFQVIYLIKGRDSKAVKEFLEENKELFKINPQKDLTLKEVKSDDLGMKHYVYTRSINKIPVDGAQFIVHTDKEGKSNYSQWRCPSSCREESLKG